MNRLVPKLRFDGFSGEWDKYRLGEVVDFFDGQRKPIKESDRANMQGKYPYYGASGIIDYVNDYIFDEDLILLGEDGENIVSRNSPLVFKVTSKCWINNHAHVLKPKKSHCLDFLVQYMENLSYLKYNSGGAQPKLNQAVCKTIPLTLPKPEEQQKIANCLSSLDNLIESQNKKVEALKKHKKGLMQQLFPKDGEKEPKLRFDGFSGEWEEKKLREIARLTSSKRIYLSDYVDKGIPFYRGKEISKLKNNNIIDDLLYIKESKYLKIKEEYGVPIKNDILITAVGTLGNILRIKDNKPFYFKDGNLIWLKEIKINYHFLEYLLDFKKNKILNSAIGSSQKALTMLSLNKIQFILPKQKEEQQKIANCLSSLDNLIESQNKKIETLKKHKKGLMQQLFVSSEG